MKETTNPFSLAVFNDMLYWSDAKKRVVLAAHKFSGKNHQILLKRPRQPFGVKVRKKRLSAVGVFFAQVQMRMVLLNLSNFRNCVCSAHSCWLHCPRTAMTLYV